MAGWQDGNSWGYVCTHDDLAGYHTAPTVLYRCKVCGRVDKDEKTARRHKRWRWLKDRKK